MLNEQYEIISGRKFKTDTVYCFFASNKKYGVSVLNVNGKYDVLLPPIYDSTSYEKNDTIFTVTYNNEEHSSSAHYRIFDLNGKQLAEFSSLEHLSFLGDGLIIRKNQKKGVLNENFIISIPCEYQEVIPISKTVYSVKKYDLDENNQEHNHSFNGIIDLNNNKLGEFDFTSFIFHHVYNDTIIIGVDKSFISIEPEYQSYNIISKELKKLPYCEILDGHINDWQCNGQNLYRTITSIDYENQNDVFEYFNYSQETYPIGKWGVIYPNGDELIKNEYDYLERLDARLYKVAIGDPKIDWDSDKNIGELKGFKWGIIDLQNNTILKIEYDWISLSHESQSVITNKGGNILWFALDHSPEWTVEGGVLATFDLNKIVRDA